eukprot:14330976-Alexandrium_andersonii.AAC.1
MRLEVRPPEIACDAGALDGGKSWKANPNKQFSRSHAWAMLDFARRQNQILAKWANAAELPTQGRHMAGQSDARLGWHRLSTRAR